MTLLAARALLAAEPRRPDPEAAKRPPMPFRTFVERVLRQAPTPAMAAIMDASEGLPVTTIDDETSVRMFGCVRSALPRTKPLIVVVVAGGRAGKTTRLAAPKMLHAAWTARLETLAPGESAQSAIIAPKRELSQQGVDAARGLIEQTRELREAVIGGTEPSDDDDGKVGTAHAIKLRRRDGKAVQVRLRAPGKGGTGGRGFVLPVAVLEEAAFFYADETKVINDEEIFAAALQRVAMPDGQLWIITTPLYEGVGVAERFVESEWGKHVEALVVRAPTRLLNPTWDPDRRIERTMRSKDPDRARREIDAIGMPVGGGNVFYSEDEIAASFKLRYEAAEDERADVQRWEGEPPALALLHIAGADMGFRKNSSALVISRSEEGTVRMVFRLELRPAKGCPLKPSEVVREFAFWAMRYHSPAILGDIHSADATHEELAKLRRAMENPSDADTDQRAWVERVRADPFACSARVPVYVEWSVDVQHVATAHTTMRTRMQEGQVLLPADEHMKGQARGTRRKILPSGQIVIVLPTHGLAHGDVWGAAVIACTEAPVGVRRERQDERVVAAGSDDWQPPPVERARGGAAYEVSEWD